MKHLKTRPQTTNGNTSNESIIKNSAFTNSEERRRENIEIEIAGPQEY